MDIPEERLPVLVKIIEWAQKHEIKIESLTQDDFWRAIRSKPLAE